MRRSAAIEAMVVKAPMGGPSRPRHAGRSGRGAEIDQRTLRDAGAAAFGKVGTGGTEFARGESGHRFGLMLRPFL